VYKYTKSEILLGPPHFSDQSYATAGHPAESAVNGYVENVKYKSLASSVFGSVR